MLYSTKELGGRRVLAAYTQAPVPALGLGTGTTGGSPAPAAEPRSCVLGRFVRARLRAGSLPRAPPGAFLPPTRPGGQEKTGPMCVGPAISDQYLSANDRDVP